MIYDFKIHRTYSFEVYPAAVLPTDYKNVTVLGILDWESAGLYIDVPSQHARCYGFLPEGMYPNDYKVFTFLKVRFQGGGTTAIAAEWVNSNTVSESNAKTAIVRIPNVSPDQAGAILNALAHNGYPKAEISFV